MSNQPHQSLLRWLSDEAEGSNFGESCIDTILKQLRLRGIRDVEDLNLLNYKAAWKSSLDTDQQKQSLFTHAARIVGTHFGKGKDSDVALLGETRMLPAAACQRASDLWYRMPFCMKVFLDGSVGGAFREGSVLDQWICGNEESMQARLVLDSRPGSVPKSTVTSDLEGSQWKEWMVPLSTAGGAIFGKESSEGTYDINRPSEESLTGLRVLDFHRKNTMRIRNIAAFQHYFNDITRNALRGLDWSHVLVAGGLVLAAMTAGLTGKQPWIDAIDVDLFLYGLSEEDAIAELRHIENVYKSNLPSGVGYSVLRNSGTVTFVPHKYPNRRIQVILKLCKNPMEILLNFDLDQVCVGYDGEEVWMLPRCARSLITGYSVFSTELYRGHYSKHRGSSQHYRLFKYCKRGWGLRFLQSHCKAAALKSLPVPSSFDDVDSSLEGGTSFDLLEVLEEQRLRVRWFVASHGRRDFTHKDVDPDFTASTDEDNARRFLRSWTVLARQVALVELAQTNAVSLQLEEPTWLDSFYDGRIEHCDTSLIWNDTVSGRQLESAVMRIHKDERQRSIDHIAAAFGTAGTALASQRVADQFMMWRSNNAARFIDGPYVAPYPSSKPEICRILIANTLDEVLAKDLIALVVLPEKLAEYAAKVLPPGSLREAFANQEDFLNRCLLAHEERFWAGRHARLQQPRQVSKEHADFASKLAVIEDSRWLLWYRKGCSFQLASRDMDEVRDTLQAFRCWGKSGSHTMRDFAVRHIAHRVDCCTPVDELSEFRRWAHAQPSTAPATAHHPAFLHDRVWDIPRELLSRRLQLTDREIASASRRLGIRYDPEWWRKTVTAPIHVR